MSAPVWQGNGEELPVRRFIRDHCRHGNQGLAVEDLDLVLRKFRTDDPLGTLRLVEVKYGSKPLGDSKQMTFGLLDLLLHLGSIELCKWDQRSSCRYDGLYTLRTMTIPTKEHPDPFQGPGPIVKVEGTPLHAEQLAEWFEFGGPAIEPREFGPVFRDLRNRCQR